MKTLIVILSLGLTMVAFGGNPYCRPKPKCCARANAKGNSKSDSRSNAHANAQSRNRNINRSGSNSSGNTIGAYAPSLEFNPVNNNQIVIVLDPNQAKQYGGSAYKATVANAPAQQQARPAPRPVRRSRPEIYR